MRRKDKAVIDRKTIDAIIAGSEICHLACCQDNIPYLIPLSFGYDGQNVYFHTANKGRKIDIFRINPLVALSFEKDIRLIKDDDQACQWSFRFQSVIAEGQITEITDPYQKIAAIDKIMSHYSGRNWAITPEYLENLLIWKVRLDSVTGKESPAKKRRE